MGFRLKFGLDAVCHAPNWWKVWFVIKLIDGINYLHAGGSFEYFRWTLDGLLSGLRTRLRDYKVWRLMAYSRSIGQINLMNNLVFYNL